MRTKTTKEVERLTFEKMSGWQLLAGPGRELYRRFNTEMYAFLLFGSWAVYIFIKLS